MKSVLFGLGLMVFGAGSAAAQEISRFAANNVIHVVAHEIGHALIREFDLPILTYEEAMADDFATLFVLQELPERAEEILRDRMRSHLADGDEPAIFSEYLHDAQRAGRIACLAYGTDPERFIGLAEEFGMEIGDEGDDCRDSVPELARAWRRVLAPLYLPEGAPVTEVRLDQDLSTEMLDAVMDADLHIILGDLLRLFDWHSLISLEFQTCDGTAQWRRNGRAIEVCTGYIERFEALAGTLGE
jgi:hypothetical protein